MNAKLVLVKGCPAIDKDNQVLIAKYVKYAIEQLGLGNTAITIRLLGANPNEPITTGAYSPADKTVTSIAGGRHLVDFCRTIAHELTHMKQDINDELNEPYQEIGGDIEDEANARAGRITKYFVKNILTPEEKRKLGLGSYK